jgi:hypothetical protein
MARGKKPSKNCFHTGPEVVALLRQQAEARRRKIFHQRARAAGRECEIKISCGKLLKVL